MLGTSDVTTDADIPSSTAPMDHDQQQQQPHDLQMDSVNEDSEPIVMDALSNKTSPIKPKMSDGRGGHEFSEQEKSGDDVVGEEDDHELLKGEKSKDDDEDDESQDVFASKADTSSMDSETQMPQMVAMEGEESVRSHPTETEPAVSGALLITQEDNDAEGMDFDAESIAEDRIPAKIDTSSAPSVARPKHIRRIIDSDDEDEGDAADKVGEAEADDETNDGMEKRDEMDRGGSKVVGEGDDHVSEGEKGKDDDDDAPVVRGRLAKMKKRTGGNEESRSPSLSPMRGAGTNVSDNDGSDAMEVEVQEAKEGGDEEERKEKSKRISRRTIVRLSDSEGDESKEASKSTTGSGSSPDQKASKRKSRIASLAQLKKSIKAVQKEESAKDKVARKEAGKKESKKPAKSPKIPTQPEVDPKISRIFKKFQEDPEVEAIELAKAKEAEALKAKYKDDDDTDISDLDQDELLDAKKALFAMPEPENVDPEAIANIDKVLFGSDPESSDTPDDDEDLCDSDGNVIEKAVRKKKKKTKKKVAREDGSDESGGEQVEMKPRKQRKASKAALFEMKKEADRLIRAQRVELPARKGNFNINDLLKNFGVTRKEPPKRVFGEIPTEEPKQTEEEGKNDEAEVAAETVTDTVMAMDTLAITQVNSLDMQQGSSLLVEESIKSFHSITVPPSIAIKADRSVAASQISRIEEENRELIRRLVASGKHRPNGKGRAPLSEEAELFLGLSDDDEIEVEVLEVSKVDKEKDKDKDRKITITEKNQRMRLLAEEQIRIKRMEEAEKIAEKVAEKQRKKETRKRLRRERGEASESGEEAGDGQEPAGNEHVKGGSDEDSDGPLLVRKSRKVQANSDDSDDNADKSTSFIDENAGLPTSVPSLRKVLSSPRTPLGELPLEDCDDGGDIFNPVTPTASDDDNAAPNARNRNRAGVSRSVSPTQIAPLEPSQMEKKDEYELDEEGFAITNNDYSLTADTEISTQAAFQLTQTTDTYANETVDLLVQKANKKAEAVKAKPAKKVVSKPKPQVKKGNLMYFFQKSATKDTVTTIETTQSKNGVEENSDFGSQDLAFLSGKFGDSQPSGPTQPRKSILGSMKSRSVDKGDKSDEGEGDFNNDPDFPDMLSGAFPATAPSDAGTNANDDGQTEKVMRFKRVIDDDSDDDGGNGGDEEKDEDEDSQDGESDVSDDVLVARNRVEASDDDDEVKTGGVPSGRTSDSGGDVVMKEKQKPAKSKFVETEAAEEEDEFMGLGGTDGEDSDDEDLACSGDEDEITDFTAVVELHRKQLLDEDQKQVDSLINDVTMGGLRKRIGRGGGAKGFDLSDSEDEAELLRAIRRRATHGILEEEVFDDDERPALSKYAANPKTAAFGKCFETFLEDDRECMISSEEEDLNPIKSIKAVLSKQTSGLLLRRQGSNVSTASLKRFDSSISMMERTGSSLSKMGKEFDFEKKKEPEKPKMKPRRKIMSLETDEDLYGPSKRAKTMHEENADVVIEDDDDPASRAMEDIQFGSVDVMNLIRSRPVTTEVAKRNDSNTVESLKYTSRGTASSRLFRAGSRTQTKTPEELERLKQEVMKNLGVAQLSRSTAGGLDSKAVPMRTGSGKATGFLVGEAAKQANMGLGGQGLGAPGGAKKGENGAGSGVKNPQLDRNGSSRLGRAGSLLGALGKQSTFSQ
ncbi:hypothetical protein HDU76_009238 [Blyttiomyces sp. JEL0837]|nr:hypothetical protein HDU76_009238 [Blyttiomyces sp. JEL0837]